MKLSDIDLTAMEVASLRRWLGDLDKHYELEAAARDADQAEQAQAEERAGKIVAIAREWAECHGTIAWMIDEHQAAAAYASWFDAAGYGDVDEHFSPDDDDQELWETAYQNRLAELRSAS